MFADVVHAGLFAQFHRVIDDRLLDDAARTAGCASGIGRLSLASDAMLDAIFERLHLRPGDALLDIGCGRGFVERWLSFGNSVPVRAVGIDRSQDAVNAATAFAPEAEFITDDYRTHRFDRRFDAALALEIATTGFADAQLPAIAHAALVPGGRFAVTAVSLTGDEDALRAHMLDGLTPQFSRCEVVDATGEAGVFARALYGSWLRIDAWDPLIAPRMRAQATLVIDALDRGTFRYAIGFAVA